MATPSNQGADGLGGGGGKSLVPQPNVLVIFGCAGDLAWRKLLPGVYNLNVDGVLPAHFAVVGFGMGSKAIEGSPDDWVRARARDGIQKFSRQPLDPDHWADFSRALFFVEGSFGDSAAYQRLKAKLDEIDKQFGVPGSRVYYLSIGPNLVPMCVDHLKEAGMVAPASETRAFTRVIVEKPVGTDLPSAKSIMADVAKAFDEHQTYRIDHYLGKETVQNVLVMRFANSIFEPLWNQKYIDHVQVTVAEAEGLAQYAYDAQGNPSVTSSRAGYYEGVGALRDMLQNHMLQSLCLVAMEPPYSTDANVVRDAKVNVLKCLRPMTEAQVPDLVVRGQYIAGSDHGKQVFGYRREVREYFDLIKQPIPPESVNATTESFVAMKCYIDNWRWAGVPFYLRTGKRLPKRASEVSIQFRDVPNVLFNTSSDTPLEPTVLTIRVQPEEGLSMRIASKLPGPKVRIYPVKMEFNYASSFGGTTPEAYERLMLDVMAGDPTLFMRRDAVESAWEFVMPILNHWAGSASRDLPEYQAGTWGPVEADRLIERDGRRWRNL